MRPLLFMEMAYRTYDEDYTVMKDTKYFEYQGVIVTKELLLKNIKAEPYFKS